MRPGRGAAGTRARATATGRQNHRPPWDPPVRAVCYRAQQMQAAATAGGAPPGRRPGLEWGLSPGQGGPCVRTFQQGHGAESERVFPRGRGRGRAPSSRAGRRRCLSCWCPRARGTLSRSCWMRPGGLTADRDGPSGLGRRLGRARGGGPPLTTGPRGTSPSDPAPCTPHHAHRLCSVPVSLGPLGMSRRAGGQWPRPYPSLQCHPWWFLGSS